MSTPGNLSNLHLKEQLLEVHQTLMNRTKAEIWINALLISLAWLMTLIFAEEIFYLPPIYKIVLLLALAGFSVWGILHGLKTLRPLPFIEFYRAFSRFANIAELTYALDLEKDMRGNPRLVEAAIFKNLELVDSQIITNKLTDYLKRNPASARLQSKRYFGTAFLVLFVATAVGFPEATTRLSQFWQSFKQPNPFSYRVLPGFTTLEQGSSFQVEISFEGAIPGEVSLYLKTPVEENFRRRGMDGASGTFSSSPIDLNTDIAYYVEMDGFNSPVYEATVQLRPRFTELFASLVSPRYTGLDSARVSYPFAQVEGMQGAQVKISGKVNKPLAEFLIQNSDFQQDVYLDDSLNFEYNFTLTQPDTFNFILTDANNLQNSNPFRFTVSAVLDEYPYVEILEPTGSYEEVEPNNVALLFRANDDFSITSARLSFELQKAFVQTPSAGSLALQTPLPGVLQTYNWDLTSLSLKPKDALTFWVEVTDNDEINGYKTSRSDKITLTIPSLIDYFEELGKQEEEIETDLEDISESFEEMQEQYELFKEQLKDDPEVNYEQQRQLQEVQKQQEEIEKRIEELNNKFEEIKEELDENSLMSEETKQAYEELQKLMEEIDDPAFREALQKLQERMNTMSPEQLREAMENAEFNEKLYKERLERTIELFKQLKLDSGLENLARAYEDLARQEEELENKPNNSIKTEQSESTLEQIEQLKKQLENLTENTTEKTEQSIRELQQLSNEELETIKKELEKRIDELKKQAENQSGESENSEQSEQSEGEQNTGEQQQNQPPENQSPSMKENFEKLAQMTRNSMQQMQQQQMNVNIAGLQYILYSLLTLSIEQEELVNYASAAESRSPAYIEYARDQKNVGDIFKSLSDSLYQLSTEIPQFSNRINEKKLGVENQLALSLEQMAERDQSRASVATRQALGGINEIAYMIANLLEQLQNQSGSGSGGGGGMSMQQMIEQMQQMGQDQQQLNQQMQEFINDLQGERLSQDQMGRLNQLSKQQNQIRQQLQEIQSRGELEGGDQLGSELERMIEQMEETINDLRGGAVDPTLIERQQNILSRMLEAEKAMQERDEEEQREATTGRDLQRSTPPEMTLEELEQEIRNRLNDPNFTKFSADYQRLIERYFELLKEHQKREIQ